MKTIYFLKGLPASGKSSWAIDMVEKSKDGIVRVNKDDLRAMLHAGEHSRGREQQVLQVRDYIIRNSLERGKHVIIDDTNFHPKHEENIRNIAELYGAIVKVKFFDTPLEECIARDEKRPKPVGEDVIQEMYDKYLAPHRKVERKEQDWSLPLAIICDLDGTLALLNGRDPYDASTCSNDLVNEPVEQIINRFDDTHKIIFVSGRSEKYREQTEEWLSDHTAFFEPYLLMRPEGDNRKDSIIKQEIYDNHIKGKYYIRFVLDDRDQVVKMWRELGLTCLQVNYGNF